MQYSSAVTVIIINYFISFLSPFLLSLVAAARRPFIPTGVIASVTGTSAYITFTIPAIAYTPEQYHIEFIGLKLQNTLTNSTVISGTNNITATDLVYSITLNGLEEANSYNFSVVSTNCQGSTRTQVANFITLSAGRAKLSYCPHFSYRCSLHLRSHTSMYISHSHTTLYLLTQTY